MTVPAGDEHVGPGRQLLDYYAQCQDTPTFAALSWDETDAFRDRVIAVHSVDQLPAEDQAFLRRCWADLTAGLSPTLQRETFGDWAAEDEALDAADESKALPAADDDGWVGV